VRYLEDLEVGDVIELGSTSVTEDEIVAFATRFDPQPFHLDDDAAAASPFGGLIASGWHTCALYMRLLVDGFLGEVASFGSPGMDELRWLRPVRPGDTLHGRYEVVEVRPSASRPDRGSVRARAVLTDDAGREVLTMQAVNLVGRRP
jgi:acyl dehydratase